MFGLDLVEKVRNEAEWRREVRNRWGNCRGDGEIGSGGDWRKKVNVIVVTRRITFIILAPTIVLSPMTQVSHFVLFIHIYPL